MPAAPGSKYRVLKVDYISGEKEGYGKDYSWRVYMESIPTSENGVEKEGE